MTRDELYAYLEAPHTMHVETALPELKALVEAYPYCASYVFLYLYALARSGDLRYASQLKRLALYLPDRAWLYRLIESADSLPQVEPLHDTGQSLDPFALIDSYLGEMQAQGEDLPSELLYATGADRADYFSSSEEAMTSVELVPLEQLSSPRDTAPPLRSPSPWPTPREEDEDLEESLFTETLAKIYIQQGKYDKALRIIRSISLNYPEKNLYFADLIRFLQRLISNK